MVFGEKIRLLGGFSSSFVCLSFCINHFIFFQTRWLFLVIFAVGTLENSSDAPPFHLMRTMFEVVSAYGTIYFLSFSFFFFLFFNTTCFFFILLGNIGLSIGILGNENPSCPTCSYASIVTPMSKLLIMMVMLIGRHRGMPPHVYMNDMRLISSFNFFFI